VGQKLAIRIHRRAEKEEEKERDTRGMERTGFKRRKKRRKRKEEEWK